MTVILEASRRRQRSRRSELGQIRRFPAPGYNAGYVIRQQTLVGILGRTRNAPKAASPAKVVIRCNQ